MNKALIIGCSGAGKSTFARELARLTGLPLIHLDQLFWRTGWAATDPAKWRAITAQLLTQDRWIIDGNFTGTMEQRIAAADVVYFFDLPRWYCLWRLAQRYLQWHGRARPDMTPGCTERIEWEFLNYVWTFNTQVRPTIAERLANAPGKVIVFKSARDIALYLAVSPGQPPAVPATP